MQNTLILKQLQYLNEVVRMVEYIYLPFTQLALYQGRREVCSPMLPMKVVPYPAYTLFKDLKGGMVRMEFQDEMVEIGPQDYRRERYPWLVGTTWDTRYILYSRNV